MEYLNFLIAPKEEKNCHLKSMFRYASLSNK